MSQAPALSRRALVAATLPALISPPAFAHTTPVHAQSGEAAFRYAVEESDELFALERQINKGAPQSVIDSWEQRESAFYRWAEGLPMTGDFARAKAVAFRQIYRGQGLQQFLAEHFETTDVRLSLQVAMCVLAGAEVA